MSMTESLRHRNKSDDTDEDRDDDCAAIAEYLEGNEVYGGGPGAREAEREMVWEYEKCGERGSRDQRNLSTTCPIGLQMRSCIGTTQSDLQ